MSTYRNHEGYRDPTAGEALANITREEKRKRKQLRQDEIQERIQSPNRQRYVNRPKNRRHK